MGDLEKGLSMILDNVLNIARSFKVDCGTDYMTIEHFKQAIQQTLKVSITNTSQQDIRTKTFC